QKKLRRSVFRRLERRRQRNLKFNEFAAIIDRLRFGLPENFLGRGVVGTDRRLTRLAEDSVGQGTEEGRLAGVIQDRRSRKVMKEGSKWRLKLYRIVPKPPAPASLLPSIELLGKLPFECQRRDFSAADRLLALSHHE